MRRNRMVQVYLYFPWESVLSFGRISLTILVECVAWTLNHWECLYKVHVLGIANNAAWRRLVLYRRCCMQLCNETA